jgi:hypothetical protein
MYGLQSALYQEGAAAAGFSDEPLIFVLISTASPCVIAKTLPQRFIDLGKTQLDRALADLSARMSFGDWTPDGYGSIDELYMPEFCFKDYQGGDA